MKKDTGDLFIFH